MKHILILISSVLFSILFYEKSIGLNLLLFAIVTLSILVVHNPEQFKSKRVMFYTIAYTATAVFVFIQDSGLSVIANCVSFFTLVGAVSNDKTSIYIHWINGIFSSVAAFFFRTVEGRKNKKGKILNKKTDVLHLVKLVGIPLVFIIVFVLLYKQGNPMFNNLVDKISFNFINVQWILFTVLGYYLFSNISTPVLVEPATSKDINTKTKLHKTESFSEEKLKKEKQLGTTLLGLLNLLIIVYIATDIASLVTLNITRAPDMSAQVHHGINTLIASILIAIVIILYFFRGNLNFYSENKILKNLSYLWILLNVVLIVLIAIKNQNYITSFGLTYKRVGVHVYIFLTLIGLITTFLKVMHIKNMVFLFRVNTQIAFAILVLFSTINWDYHITRYNLNYVNSYDLNYLIDLSEGNAIQLKNHSLNTELDPKFYNKIDAKYANYLRHLKQKDWQEKSFEDFSITEEEKNL